MEGSFSKIKQMLGYKTNLYKYRKIETIPTILLCNRTNSTANKTLASAYTTGD